MSEHGDPQVGPALINLIHDADVGLHAMIAIRKVLGPAQALTYIEEVKKAHADTPLADQASREIRKLRKVLAS